jgi:hypothetical protein
VDPVTKAAEEFRAEAQQLRERAESVDDDERRRQLFRVAEIYENWARDAEVRRSHW